jgi:hypothetical protein
MVDVCAQLPQFSPQAAPFYLLSRILKRGNPSNATALTFFFRGTTSFPTIASRIVISRVICRSKQDIIPRVIGRA